MKLIHGDIVYTPAWDKMVVLEDHYIAVEDGMVADIFEQIPSEYGDVPIEDYGRALIIPAFSDLHIHAPQYAQRGTGMDMLLYDWLNSYTFPEEAKFSNLKYADFIYSHLVDDMIKNGTFHASVFTTIHKDSALRLAEHMEKRGMHGFVGKVNMDCGSPDYLCETVEASVKDTEDFLASFRADANIRPILTPRFAPTCSKELLRELGKLAKKYECGMQTHLVESRWEAAEALRLFPDCRSDAEIYEKAGLLAYGPSIFAHFIFPTDEDIRIIQKYNAITVHCPDATNNVIAGIMPVAALNEKGVRVVSGTDVGAGSKIGIFSQIASTIRLSKLKAFYEPEANASLKFSEAFYMATKAGGSVFGKFGSFEKGFIFDALVLDGMEDGELHLSAEKRLERFCYNGDDRNIIARYMSGSKL